MSTACMHYCTALPLQWPGTYNVVGRSIMNFVPRAVAKKKTVIKKKVVPPKSIKSDTDVRGHKPSISTKPIGNRQSDDNAVAGIGQDIQNVGDDLKHRSHEHSPVTRGSLNDASSKQTEACEDVGKKESQSIRVSHVKDDESSIDRDTSAAEVRPSKLSASEELNKAGDTFLLENVQLSKPHKLEDEEHRAVVSESVKLHTAKLDKLHRLSDSISSQLSRFERTKSECPEATHSISPTPVGPIEAAGIGLQNESQCARKHGEEHGHDDDLDDCNDEEGEDERPPVFSFSKNQRWPEEDEPVCVICGKYGEYICSQTEADVCSLECKAKNLVRSGLQPKTLEIGRPPDPEGPCLAPPTEEAPPPDPEDDHTDDPKGPFIYQEHKDISLLTSEQIQDIRNEVEIFVEGMNVPRPVMEFQQLGLPERLQGNLISSGYLTPTPVQMQAIPAGLGLRDVMVCAQTSSGKTASFLVPAVIRIYNQIVVAGDHETKVPYVLILAPTRELAMQIEEQAKQLMKGMTSMKTALLVGGLPLPPQLHRLRQGVQFLVGTPGRILEIIRQEAVNLDEIKLVVIDEVDTMLQLGFQQQVYDIMVHLSDSHQTILTSATIPTSIEKVAASLLGNPVFISVGTPSTPVTSVKQVILWVEEPSKKKKLFAILQDPKHFSPPLIVFVDSKLGADLLAQAIEKSCGLSVASLHGDKPQKQRVEVLQRFKDGAYDVLVSTGVLGRGIDIPGVRMVINFDMPGSVEEYIHQIGRTGRLGGAGVAMTFLNNSSKKLFLQFTGTLKPLGVVLPQELVNSPHLHYQRQQHRSKHSHGQHRGPHTSREKTVEEGGTLHAGFDASRNWDRKRKKERETVTDILKHRKRKFKP